MSPQLGPWKMDYPRGPGAYAPGFTISPRFGAQERLTSNVGCTPCRNGITPEARRSRQNRLDNLPPHVGHAKVAALESVHAPEVIDPEQGQDRGMQTADAPQK